LHVIINKLLYIYIYICISRSCSLCIILDYTSHNSVQAYSRFTWKRKARTSLLREKCFFFHTTDTADPLYFSSLARMQVKYSGRPGKLHSRLWYMHFVSFGKYRRQGQHKYARQFSRKPRALAGAPVNKCQHVICGIKRLLCPSHYFLPSAVLQRGTGARIVPRAEQERKAKTRDYPRRCRLVVAHVSLARLLLSYYYRLCTDSPKLRKLSCTLHTNARSQSKD